MEKLFITNIYWFYLFSVFWLTKVVIILFNDYSVIVKRFILDNFIEYIIYVKAICKCCVKTIFCQ